MDRFTIPNKVPTKYMLEVSGISIDIRPYFFISLSIGDNDKSYIRRRYEEKKWTYFEAYRNSSYKNNPELLCYPTDVEEIIRMVIGIYEASEQTGDFDILLSIIRNQYRDLYRFVDTRRIFDESDFISYLNKKNKSAIPDAQKFIYSLYIAMFLCHHFQKDMALTVTTTEAMIGIATSAHTPEKRKQDWENENGNLKEKVLKLSEEYALPIPAEDFRLWEYIGKEVQKFELWKDEPGRHIDPTHIEHTQERLDAFVAFGDIVESLGIDPFEIQNISLPPGELERMVQEYAVHIHSHPRTKIDFNQFIFVYYYMRRLAVMYQDAKRRLLDTSEEEKFLLAKEKELEIQEKELEIQERESKIEQVEKDAKLRATQLNKKNEELQKELTALKRKERNWEKERQENAKNTKELTALRTLLYRLEKENQSDIVVPEDQLQHMMDTVNEKRIVFFGGHPNWVQRVKEYFPNARFIDVDDINRNITFIKGYDVVCINFEYFNHGFYAKLMNEVSKHSTEIMYVSGKVTNKERLVREIFEQLN